MPRRPRNYQAEISSHVTQRGNNRQRCFFSDRDRLRYLAYLQRASGEYGCAIHAYVLMTNHVHLLVTPREATGISLMMQSLGRSYVQYVNRRLGRTGTLWEGRHNASLVDTEGYWYTCARYIELNPVRAGMVSDPGDFRWSSHRGNTRDWADPLLQPHDLYLVLGDDVASRRRAYRELFDQPVADADLDLIRTATQRGTSFSREAGLKNQPVTSATPTPSTAPR